MANTLFFMKLFAFILVSAVALWCMALYSPTLLSGSSSTGDSSLEFTDDGFSERAFDCTAILKGDQEEVAKAKLLSIQSVFRQKVNVGEEHYVNATQDCRQFILSRKYLQYPLSKEEEDFPLAYVIVVHHKVQNFERLLRAIYAPQNVYCIHVDQKVKSSTLAAFISITSCFPNVIMASRPVSVTYAGWSRVQADLNCMSDLYSISSTWKYLINLCGQDFPLKTNLEMVRSIRALGGGNSVESRKAPPHLTNRWTFVYQEVDGILKKTDQKNAPPPNNIPLHSGSAYILVSRGYVHSVLTDSRIQALKEWAKSCYSPDENFWATIQRMPGVPGWKRPHPNYDITESNAIARLVRWDSWEGPDNTTAAYPPCEGQHVNSVCVYGAGDLHWIIQQHHLFANKFDINMDYMAIDCLDRYLRHKALTDSAENSASQCT